MNETPNSERVIKAVQEVIQTNEVTSPMPLAFIVPGKLLKEIHKMDA